MAIWFQCAIEHSEAEIGECSLRGRVLNIHAIHFLDATRRAVDACKVGERVISLLEKGKATGPVEFARFELWEEGARYFGCTVGRMEHRGGQFTTAAHPQRGNIGTWDHSEGRGWLNV